MNAHKRIAIAVTVSLILTLASATRAASIGINFRGTNNGLALAVGDSAGAVPQANWNNSALAAFEPVAAINNPVNNSNVAQSGMSVSLHSLSGNPKFEGWGNDTGVLTDASINTPDDKLLEGWFQPKSHDGTPNDLTITVTGIPYAYYDLYVYYVQNAVPTNTNYPDLGNVNIYNTSGGTLLAESYFHSISYTNKFNGTMTTPGYVQNPFTTLVALGSTVSAATHFSGLTSATLFLDTNAVTLQPADDVWGPGIAGIQFVETEAPSASVPEPSSFALAALGLAGLGFVVWRRRGKNVE